MFCAYTRPRYQVSAYRTIGPLVTFMSRINFMLSRVEHEIFLITSEPGMTHPSLHSNRGKLQGWAL